jgi:uncharacterized protein
MAHSELSSTALVTGATSGIGRAFAVELARRGHRLVLVARDGARLRQLADELPGAAHEVLVADLASDAGCRAVGERLERDQDPVDLLVNAAGLGTGGGYPDVALEQEEAQLDVNATAVLRLGWVAARAMRRRGRGAIVNIASTAAIWSVGTYAASKAWVVKATQGLAASLADDPVAVLCVIPGFTRTEFHRRSGVDNSGVRSWMWLRPETVARESLSALAAGRSECIPGRQYRILVPIARRLPARARKALLSRLAPLRPSRP